MAVTRRQFVAGMSALAASMGFNSAQIAKITEALAYGNLAAKPKVLWVHGAECTGCSVSLLSLYEDARGKAIEGTTISTLDALGLAAPGEDVLADMRTLQNNGFNVDGSPYAVNIQDILVDWLDLQYHETVMTAGGDLAYQVLKDNMDWLGSSDPFVLVVEGATQDHSLGGAWNDTGTHPWCSIGMNDAGTDELSFDDVVESLSNRADCLGVISIGQCASFGGYPSAVPPIWKGKGDNKGRQTGSMGTHEFLTHKSSAAANKVVNVPGCPPNPWWFVLTVVAFLVDLQATLGTTDETGPLGILGTPGGGLPQIVGGVDNSRRLNAVYGTPLHGPACPRYAEFVKGNFADAPGDDGCLQLIGCKGPSVNSLCGVHGWNGQQPQNRQSTATVDGYGVAEIGGIRGGNCIAAGHPCMGCTEAGYPDAFVPFVLR
ncbi:MAG: hypothetical protein IBX63_07860 [Coriobacteriia bacterium]|nr:hypothetical protein [Coriobacteriia bacterium]